MKKETSARKATLKPALLVIIAALGVAKVFGGDPETADRLIALLKLLVLLL